MNENWVEKLRKLSMKNIKAILFDFGGTLDSDGIDWGPRIYNYASKQVGALDWEAFYKCAVKAGDDLCKMPDTLHLNMDETADRFCRQIHLNMSDANDYPWDQKALQWDPAKVAKDFMSDARDFFQRNRGILDKLRKRFQLGCISNNWGNAAGWCRQYQLSEYFDTIIDSTVVGAAKPDKAIFQAALDELQLPAQSCVYVGDKYDCDILGAHGVGMGAIWITDNNETNSCSDQTVKHSRISKLTDLENIDWD